MLTRHAFRLALVFAIVGAICRFILRTVETRWQSMGLWCVVGAYQFALRPALGRRVSAASAAIDLAAVTLAVVAMKLVLEGKLSS